MKFLAKKVNNALYPIDEVGLEAMDKIKYDVEITVKKIRNVRFHSKFFALLKIVFDNQEIFDDKEFLREELTKAAGYYTHYKNHLGVSCYKAKSISFEKMDEIEFESFYNSFLQKCCEIFNFDQELIENENG